MVVAHFDVALVRADRDIERGLVRYRISGRAIGGNQTPRIVDNHGRRQRDAVGCDGHRACRPVGIDVHAARSARSQIGQLQRDRRREVVDPIVRKLRGRAGEIDLGRGRVAQDLRGRRTLDAVETLGSLGLRKAGEGQRDENEQRGHCVFHKVIQFQRTIPTSGRGARK
jgi:hypothetical protein